MSNPLRPAALLLAACAALSLVGCSAGDDAGIDDMLDAAGISTTAAAVGSCAVPVPSRTDAGITRRILTALAADPALRAWQIDVDTVDGKVVLHGRVPDGPMRERATRLALAVPGVTLVDSLLDIHS